MSTPGQEAMREAMRIEQARIYSRTVVECPRLEVRAKPAVSVDEVDLLFDIAEADRRRVGLVRFWAGQGESVSKIAFRLGRPRTEVAEIVQQLRVAS